MKLSTLYWVASLPLKSGEMDMRLGEFQRLFKKGIELCPDNPYFTTHLNNWRTNWRQPISTDGIQALKVLSQRLWDLMTKIEQEEALECINPTNVGTCTCKCACMQ